MLQRLILALLCISYAAFASAERQSLASLKQIAIEYIKAQNQGLVTGRIEVDASNLDTRIRVNKCQGNPIAFLPSSYKPASARAVGVKCLSPKWQIYVPVKIKIFSPAVVAARPLKAGMIVNFSDVSVKEVNIKRLRHHYYEDPEKLIGKQIKHTVKIGQAITKRDVIEPKVIKRGQFVRIQARNGALAVTMNGIAMQDGRVNQLIRVKNSSTGRVIQAVVRSAQVVEVNLGKK